MLKKVTKTIPLTGGEQDDAPEFLLEPPGMAYVQNARFRKQDSIEKTEPLESIGSARIDSPYNPGILFEDGDDLVTIGGNEISRYTEGTGWVTESLDTEVLGIDKILSTIEESGGVNYVWAPFAVEDSAFNSWTIGGYCVAFERRVTSAFVDPEVAVVIQRYDTDKVLLDEVVTENCVSPVTQTMPNGACRVFYTGTNGNLYQRYMQPAPATNIGSQSTMDTSVSVQYQAFNTFGQWDGVEHDRLRPGFTYNSRYHAAVKYKHPIGSDNGVLAYKTDATPGSITIREVLPTGFIGPPSTILTETEVEGMISLLDVDIDNQYYYVLYATHDTSVVGLPPADGTTTCKVDVRRYEKAAPTVFSHENVSALGNGTVAQGSVRLAVDGSVRCAFHRMFRDPWTQGLVTRDNGLRFRSVNSSFSSVTILKGIYNHRLASNIEINSDGDIVCVVQQFDNTYPNNSKEPNNAYYSATPAAIKPVTSTLVTITSDTAKPIAVFDSGQSKDKLSSYSEQNIHYGNLYYIDGYLTEIGGVGDTDVYDNSYFYGNSVALTGEDYALNMDTSYPLGSGNTELKRSLLIGESKCSIYHCGSGIPISASVLNRSFILNSAIPLWYTNGDVTELSVIDQPEIVYLDCFDEDGNITRTDGPISSYSATAVTDWRAFQVVVGFFDASGHVHRSAPSFPVFVENAFEQPRYYLAEIGISMPLSFRGQNFFAEVYEAAEGDELQLAGVTHVDTSNTEGPVELSVVINIDEQTIPRTSESLYTTGGVLPSDPWPNMTQTTSSSRRLFGLSESAPGVIFYSKIFEENVAPEFSASLVISTGSFRELTAIKALDDKVFIFERDRIHFLYGSGPDNTGANGDFILERMQTTLGCIDPQSLVTTPDGLMFYSSVSGEFHLITRDLQIVDVGKPVMDLSVGITVDAVVLYQEEHEVRFFIQGSGSSDWGPDPDTGTNIPDRPPRPRFGRSTPSSFSTLVYNYHYKKWTIHTGVVQMTAATTYNNKPVMLTTNWLGAKVSNNWYGSSAMVWETPWIKVNQLQDYGRFYWATILGKYLSSWSDQFGVGALEGGDLKVTVKYDYEGLPQPAVLSEIPRPLETDTYLFRANQDFDPTDGNRLQFRVRPGRQKCQAIKFIIEEQVTEKLDDSEPDYTLGRGFELTAIDLVYGAKGGSSRNFGIRRQK